MSSLIIAMKYNNSIPMKAVEKVDMTSCNLDLKKT